VLRRVLGPKKDEVTWEWRKSHNEGVTQCCVGGKIEKNEMGGHVVRMGEGRGVHRILVGTPEGKKPLGRPRRRWEDNIKTDLQEVGVGCGDWMELAQDRERWRELVSTVMNFRVPYNVGSFLTVCRTS
jgi:hypothetical protein